MACERWRVRIPQGPLVTDKIVLFSHGMGVLQDNRGLFTYLSERIHQRYPSIKCHFFDYNDIDIANKLVHVKPFSDQAKILQEHIDEIVQANTKAMLYIVCQSQGCLIPAICDVYRVHKVIGISPFFHTSKEEIISRYTKSRENVLNFEGITKRKRSDGTTTIIPANYWTERFNTNVEKLYNSLALETKLTLICALQDDIMDITNLSKIKNARIVNTDGDHDFSNQYRELAGKLVLEELEY